jgi:hypothetical protein
VLVITARWRVQFSTVRPISSLIVSDPLAQYRCTDSDASKLVWEWRSFAGPVGCSHWWIGPVSVHGLSQMAMRIWNPVWSFTPSASTTTTVGPWQWEPSLFHGLAFPPSSMDKNTYHLTRFHYISSLSLSPSDHSHWQWPRHTKPLIRILYVAAEGQINTTYCTGTF